MIRKATLPDIDRIEEIYLLIHDEEEKGHTTTGWVRGIYPVRQTAVDALERGDLFVEKADGRIVAAGIINQLQVPAYAGCQWKYPASDEEIMVLHTLVVDPNLKCRGYGRTFVNEYEKYAAEHGCNYLRMDTNEKNQTARGMYFKLGYREAGIVDCKFNGIQGVRLVCLEKRL